MKKFVLSLFLIIIMSFHSLSLVVNAQDNNIVQDDPDQTDREVVIEYIDELQEETITIKDNKTYIKYKNFSKDPKYKALSKDIEEKLQKSDQLKDNDYHKYSPEWIEKTDNQFLGVVSSYPKRQTTSEMIYPKLLVITGKKASTGVWNVYIETVDIEYNQLIDELSPDIIEYKAKKYLKIGNSYQTNSFTPATTTTYNIPGLPWTPGTSWYLTGGIHGENSCCLDLSQGGQGTVRAAEGGYRVSVGSTCVFYKNGNHTLLYQHILSSDLSSVPVTINQAEVIGKTYVGPGCGGNSTGHHVHFGIFNTNYNGLNIVGSIFNGWVVTLDNISGKTYLVKNGNSVGVGGLISYSGFFDPCLPPVSGTWIIYQNCEIREVFTYSGDIIVQNNSELYLNVTASIDFDFKNHKIVIKPGSKIRIGPYAKIH